MADHSVHELAVVAIFLCQASYCSSSMPPLWSQEQVIVAGVVLHDPNATHEGRLALVRFGVFAGSPCVAHGHLEESCLAKGQDLSHVLVAEGSIM